MSIRPLITVSIVLFGLVVALLYPDLPCLLGLMPAAGRLRMLSSSGYVDKEEEAASGLCCVPRLNDLRGRGACGAVLQLA